VLHNSRGKAEWLIFFFLTNSLINRGRKLKDLNMAVDDSAAHKDTVQFFIRGTDKNF
jgi:hypothetical protein